MADLADARRGGGGAQHGGAEVLQTLRHTAPLWMQGGEAAELAARTIRTYLSNVLAHPTRREYRRVKESGAAFASRVACCPGALSVLAAMGWSREQCDGRSRAGRESGLYPDAVYWVLKEVDSANLREVVRELDIGIAATSRPSSARVAVAEKAADAAADETRSQREADAAMQLPAQTQTLHDEGAGASSSHPSRVEPPSDELPNPVLKGRLRAVATDQVGLVDVRDASSYAAAHIVGSTNMPLASLSQRTAELPPSSGEHGKIRLIGSAVELEEASAFLSGDSRGWTLLDRLPATAELWSAAEAMGIVESGAASRRLWSPSPHLERVAEAIEVAAAGAGGGGGGGACRAVDLGCGRGRDAVALGQRGWHALALDNQPKFLSQVDAFAAREALSERVRTEVADLRPRDRPLAEVLAPALAPPLQLVVVSRFMSRRLLDVVMGGMPVGCVLFVHHFAAGSTSLKSGRPIKAADPDACSLAPGELRARYAADRLEVLVDVEEPGIDGRPMATFAARKLGRSAEEGAPNAEGASAAAPTALAVATVAVAAAAAVAWAVRASRR